jgi:hypothetical protein
MSNLVRIILCPIRSTDARLFASRILERRMKIRLSLFAGLWLVCTWLASPALAQSFKPGTPIQVQLLTPLDTGTARDGQEFSATLAQPVSAGKTVWPKGTQVKGKVVEVVSSGRLQRPASITLQLTQIGNLPVVTEPEQIDGKSHAGRNAGLILGGAAAGAILGDIAGGGKGAAIGAAVGAGAGTLTAIATGKREIVLRAETTLNFAVPGGAAAPPPPPPQPAYRTDANPRPEPVAESRPYPDQEAEDREREPEYRDRQPEYRDREEPEAREREQEYRDREPEDSDYRERQPESREREYDDHPQRFRVYFSDRDQDVIREYFRHDRDDRRLPPGLEKQMRRNGSLPPGLQRRAEPFPHDLERRMGSLPRGYSRVILSGRAMILRDDSEIVDMMFIHE